MNLLSDQPKYDAHPHFEIELLIFEHARFSQLEVEKVISQMEVQYLKPSHDYKCTIYERGEIWKEYTSS